MALLIRVLLLRARAESEAWKRRARAIAAAALEALRDEERGLASRPALRRRASTTASCTSDLAYLASALGGLGAGLALASAIIFWSRAMNKHQVCQLLKSVYGLKQSPRNWNHHINRFLLGLGFVPIAVDPCLYVKLGEGGAMTIVTWCWWRAPWSSSTSSRTPSRVN